MKTVGIVLAHRKDVPLAQEAIDVLRRFEIPCEVHILSAHRTPGETAEFARNARGRGLGAVIVFAGMAAHLAGCIAANTTLPVIGVPCADKYLEGMDALLSTVQMPTGYPVATVAIGSGVNAALLAVEILAVEDAEIAHLLVDYRSDMADALLEQGAELRL